MSICSKAKRYEKVDKLYKLLGVSNDIKGMKDYLSVIKKYNPALIRNASDSIYGIDNLSEEDTFNLFYDVLDEVLYELGFTGVE